MLDCGYNDGMKRANGSFIEHLLEPIVSSLNDEAARKLLRVKADAKTRARVSALASKCNEGE